MQEQIALLQHIPHPAVLWAVAETDCILCHETFCQAVRCAYIHVTRFCSLALAIRLPKATNVQKSQVCNATLRSQDFFLLSEVT